MAATDTMATAPANNLTIFSDLLYAFPRLASRAGSFALYHMPEAVDNIAGKIFNSGSMIADATGQQTANQSAATVYGIAQSTAAAGAGMLDAALREGFWQGDSEAGAAGADAGDGGSGSIFAMMVQGVGRIKSFGGIFSYLTSRWALATFTAAIVLNRTQFYASSREHLRLRWHARLALYLIPIVGFLVQLLHILQAMKCQTSPDFPLLRYGDPLKRLSIDFGGEGGFLYSLSSTLLWFQDDATACDARSMSILTMHDDRPQLRGSMNLLFKFFLTLCASQLFETLSCALQGKHPMPETGMTLFEHSLAFAECEAIISSALGFGFFGLPKESSSTSGEGTGLRYTRAEILQRINVPPEVLLVCLISCFSHLSSALLAVSGKRHKVRLINTAVWAGCYLSAFLWSFSKVFLNGEEGVADLGVLRFPTICIVGFIPHLIILIGIAACALIYALALMFTALSVPEDLAGDLSFRQRLSWAYQNLQANVQFSSASALRIKMSEDFYTTLLKIGFSVLTSASEAVYLNEGSRIHVAKMTWIEQQRIDELASALDARRRPAVPPELLGEGIARGVEFTDHHNAAVSPSPYARERKSRPKKSDPDRPNPNELDTGLGLSQRRSRMHLTADFISGMFWLLAGMQARMTIGMLRRLGIERVPDWLLKTAGVLKKSEQQQQNPALVPVRDRSLDFWMTMPDGTSRQPTDDNVDVADETRRMMRSAGTYKDEEGLGDRIYSWWTRGGWFGDLDTSSDYAPDALNDDNDDTTSMISMSTNDSNADDWSDVSSSGRRTPTQEDPQGRREETPFEETNLNSHLARLLDPRNTSDRDEARLLSYSLQSTRPFTRAQYRRDTDRTRNQLLSGLRAGAPTNNSRHTPQTSAEDDALDLEHFILAQRSKHASTSTSRRSDTWESGAEGMGAGGPQCVVCQSCPRTILVWPCGCLSMCDDCRVGLAARNHSKCICCRTDIAAYSRLYVP